MRIRQLLPLRLPGVLKLPFQISKPQQRRVWLQKPRQTLRCGGPHCDTSCGYEEPVCTPFQKGEFSDAGRLYCAALLIMQGTVLTWNYKEARSSRRCVYRPVSNDVHLDSCRTNKSSSSSIQQHRRRRQHHFGQLAACHHTRFTNSAVKSNELRRQLSDFYYGRALAIQYMQERAPNSIK